MAFFLKFGAKINKSPNKFLVVGRDNGLDHHALHKIIKSRGNEFGVLTYDDVLRSLRWHQAMSDFGTEQQFGVTISMVFRVVELAQDTEYILDFFEPETNERRPVDTERSKH